MSYLKSLILILSIQFSVSCSIKKSIPKNCSEIFIDNSEIKETKDISNHIDSLSVIPLLETQGNHIGSVFKVYFTKNCYIIFDRLSTNRILLFDSKGNFVKTIIKSGDKAQDPLNITDCWLNEKKELEVYDYAQMKVFQFDSLFNLRKIIKSNLFNHFVSLNTIPLSNQYIGYTNYNEFNKPFKKRLYQIAFLDSSLSIQNSDKVFDKIFQGITWPIYNHHFYTYKDSLRFVRSYDNFIYSVSKTGVEKRFKIDYKINCLPDDVMPIVKEHLELFKDRSLDPNIKASYLKNYSRFNGLWLENEKYVILSSKDSSGKYGTLFYSLIDKKNNEELFNARNFIDTKKYKITLPPFEYYNEIDNDFVSIVAGDKLKKLLFKESPLQDKIVSDPNIFYLLKVKFN